MCCKFFLDYRSTGWECFLGYSVNVHRPRESVIDGWSQRLSTPHSPGHFSPLFGLNGYVHNMAHGFGGLQPKYIIQFFGLFKCLHFGPKRLSRVGTLAMQCRCYPYLHNGNFVWANNNPTGLDKSLKLQKEKKALRVITFSSYSASSRPCLLAVFCFHLRTKSVSQYFNYFCSENNQVHNHFTRKSNYLHKKFDRPNLVVYSTRNKIINI